jgi:hypothetical protein
MTAELTPPFSFFCISQPEANSSGTKDPAHGMVLRSSPEDEQDEEEDDDDLDRTVMIGESNSFLEPSVGSASPTVPGSPLV